MSEVCKNAKLCCHASQDRLTTIQHTKDAIVYFKQIQINKIIRYPSIQFNRLEYSNKLENFEKKIRQGKAQFPSRFQSHRTLLKFKMRNKIKFILLHILGKKINVHFSE